MTLEVSRKGIGDILTLLGKAEWQVPKFQREFIWTPSQVNALVLSVFKSRPIGLITLWGQPQGKPHTASERIRLKEKLFGAPGEDPAVMKLILDGRQRLTSIAIVFGGLSTPDDRFWYSGRYFLNLDADAESDQFVVYKKQREIKSGNLNSLSNCTAKALIPLHDYANFEKYLQNIHNQDVYPIGSYPDKNTRERRAERLGTLYKAFQACQVPIAEIPDTISLAEVCEIFDVLNTTGTKISTFDLIHNTLYADTSGAYDLRGLFKRYQEDHKNLQLLLDDDRQDYLCQVVTGCYLSEPEPYSKTYLRDKEKASKKDKESKHIKSIKGGDLLETPTNFYETFNQNVAKIDTYTFHIFSEILGGQSYLGQIPYPVGLILYASLRWRAEMHPAKSDATSEELNRLFKAFYWRNVLSGRYDQGFLTLFATDLKKLGEILTEGVSVRGTYKWVEHWWQRSESEPGQRSEIEPPRVVL